MARSRVERFVPRKASAGSECEVIQAGTMPKTTPVPSESRSANPSTGKDGLAWIGMWGASGNASVRMVRVPAYAIARPAAPPMQPSRMLSVSI